MENKAIVTNNFLENATVQDYINLSKILGDCPFYKKLGAGGVLAILLTAKELGIPAMMSLNGGLWTFDGKVTMSTQLMNFLIVSKGHRADILTLNEQECKIRFVRGDRKGEGSTFEYSYTIQDAQNAKLLGKDNWRNNKRDMLFNRCLSGGARKFMPDVLMQAYTQEELLDCQEIKPIEESVKQKHFSETEEFKSFVEKHHLNEENEKSKYISEISETSEKSREEIINFALQNEERFLSSFQRWVDSE